MPREKETLRIDREIESDLTMKSIRINSKLIDTIKRLKTSGQSKTLPPQPQTNNSTNLRLKKRKKISNISKNGTRVTTITFRLLMKQTWNTIESNKKSRQRIRDKCSSRTQERSLIFNRTENNLHNCKKNYKKLEESTTSTIQLKNNRMLQILHTNGQQTILKNWHWRRNMTSMKRML